MTRRVWLLLACLLVPFPAWADVEVGAAKVLSAVDDCAVIALRDNQGAHVSFLANTLNGTALPKVSLNGSSAVADMVGAQFVDPTSGVVTLSYAGGGSNAAASYGIAAPVGATHAAVCLSAVTSGTVHATMRASSKLAQPFIGSDGSNLRTAKVRADAGASDDYGLVVRCVSGCAGSGGTSMTDDAAFTVGTTAFTPVGGTYKGTLDSVDDGDGGAFAMTVKRFLYTTIGTPAGDSAMDDTNDAVRTTPVTTVTIGGQSATSTTLAYPNGAGNLAAFIRPSSATTTLWITGESNEHIYVTSMFLHASGTQGVTVISGTGATCGTSSATVLGEVELSTTNGTGFTLGNGAGMVLRTNDAGDSLCITTDSATALNALATYAIY
jgi:hypothetical protein